MTEWLWYLLLFIIIQRIVELMIARNNENWMKKQGAYEVGKKHYKWFILIHSLFFMAVVVESGWMVNQHDFYPMLFTVFILTQLLRMWCLLSLGRFWNTKIIVLPGAPLVYKGPYRYLKHPNYVIVGIELAIIPLLFNAYLTAIIFPILHILVLKIRIPLENNALMNLSALKKRGY